MDGALGTGRDFSHITKPVTAEAMQGKTVIAKDWVCAQLWHRQSGGFLLMDDAVRAPESPE